MSDHDFYLAEQQACKERALIRACRELRRAYEDIEPGEPSPDIGHFRDAYEMACCALSMVGDDAAV